MHSSSIVMQDELGIVYVVENAQQFWSELEDIVEGVKDKPTLSLLDSALRRFVSLCATYHELYLQSPLQLEHATEHLLNSELFLFHSERMSEILLDDAQSNTDPHTQLIIYNTLHRYGARHAPFFRSHKRWQPLIPLLMDHVLVETDPDVEDTYFGMPVVATSNTSSSNLHYHPHPHARTNSTTSVGGGSQGQTAVPIEVKLRSVGVRVLYEICRVQKLSLQELRIFSDSFIDYLFNLVEETRDMQNETFNYSIIKLIVALNEQFMVASLTPSASPPGELPSSAERQSENGSQNRVLRILMSRLGSSKTFGENMIFMLNRANRTPEDQCMQLLVLKLLYLLFTTKGTSEYFYTNDLCVLVDVFLRELVDLDEESDSLRHTYLRVLHPLLTKTQLQTFPYKRPQIVRALESLVGNPSIRDVCPTTNRLVERCLGGEWCVQLRAPKVVVTETPDAGEAGGDGAESPGSDYVTAAARVPATLTRQSSIKTRRSLEDVSAGVGLGPGGGGNGDLISAGGIPPVPALNRVRRTSNASAASLSGVAGATTPLSTAAAVNGNGGGRREKTASLSENGGTRVGHHVPRHLSASEPGRMSAPSSPTNFQGPNSSQGEIKQVHPPPQTASQTKNSRRASPPPPPPPLKHLLKSSAKKKSTPSPLQNSDGGSLLTGAIGVSGQRRAPPAPPVKARRKPPAVPARRGSDEVRMTTIKTTSGVGVGVKVA